jgi:hypothetical protein
MGYNAGELNRRRVLIACAPTIAAMTPSDLAVFVDMLNSGMLTGRDFIEARQLIQQDGAIRMTTALMSRNISARSSSVTSGMFSLASLAAAEEKIPNPLQFINRPGAEMPQSLDDALSKFYVGFAQIKDGITDYLNVAWLSDLGYAENYNVLTPEAASDMTQAIYMGLIENID